MAAPTIANIQRIRGKICSGPTDATAAYPHGGTALGLVGSVEWRIIPIRGEVTAEEYHGQTIEIIEGAENVLLAAVLREWDSDAIAALFPSTSTSTTSGKVSASRTYTTTRGALGSSRAVKLLFSPQATEEHPALLLYRAVPLITEQASMAYSLDREWQMPVIFQGLPDATGRIYQSALLEDLTL